MARQEQAQEQAQAQAQAQQQVQEQKQKQERVQEQEVDEYKDHIGQAPTLACRTTHPPQMCSSDAASRGDVGPNRLLFCLPANWLYPSFWH